MGLHAKRHRHRRKYPVTHWKAAKAYLSGVISINQRITSLLPSGVIEAFRLLYISNKEIILGDKGDEYPRDEFDIEEVQETMDEHRDYHQLFAFCKGKLRYMLDSAFCRWFSAYQMKLVRQKSHTIRPTTPPPPNYRVRRRIEYREIAYEPDEHALIGYFVSNASAEIVKALSAEVTTNSQPVTSFVKYLGICIGVYEEQYLLELLLSLNRTHPSDTHLLPLLLQTKNWIATSRIMLHDFRVCSYWIQHGFLRHKTVQKTILHLYIRYNARVYARHWNTDQQDELAVKMEPTDLNIESDSDDSTVYGIESPAPSEYASSWPSTLATIFSTTSCDDIDDKCRLPPPPDLNGKNGGKKHIDKAG